MVAERRQAGHFDPPYLHPAYGSTVWRAPHRPLIRIPYGPTETSGPGPAALLAERARAESADLTRQHGGQPLGERIIVHGTVRDASGRPLPEALVEVWQANAAGR